MARTDVRGYEINSIALAFFCFGVGPGRHQRQSGNNRPDWVDFLDLKARLTQDWSIFNCMNGKTTMPGVRKILVVDDDRIILKTLSMLLGANGYQVFTASDGPGAVSIVSTHKPDLILLDLLFPPDAMNVGGALQDGFFIMEWLRRMGQAEDIPIIIISADHSQKDRQRALDAGALAFFSKPIDHVALLSTIRAKFGQDTPVETPVAA